MRTRISPRAWKAGIKRRRSYRKKYSSSARHRWYSSQHSSRFRRRR